MSALVCTSCEVQIPSSERTAHYGSEWHRYNVKRRCAGLPHLPQDVFMQKLEALKTMQDGEKAAKESQKCHICNKSFSAAAFQQHLNSKRHIARAGNKNSRKASDVSTLSTVSTLESKDGENKMVEDRDDENDEGDEGEVFDENKVIPSGTCMFCNKKCRSLKKVLVHMLKKHGYFIPFIEYLMDLDGLIYYFGAKVGVGKSCLYCNKIFESTRACQSHMRDKSHCKIGMDGDDVEDFMAFYKFPKRDKHAWEEDEGDEGDESDEDMETKADGDEPQWAPKKRHLASMNDAGELIMTDGSIIGHRDLIRVYKQNVRPVSRQDEIVAMMGNYRSLKLDGYDHNRKAKFSEVKHKYQQRRHKEVLKYQYRSNNMKHFVDSTGGLL